MTLIDGDIFKQATEKINSNDYTGFQDILKTNKIPIDGEDDHGMTLLHHAAFKGKKEMCQLLLDLVRICILKVFDFIALINFFVYITIQGADPNGGHHEHKYTSLHFAALSGKADICQQMLQYGCTPDALNSVGRTASQMAAFVGT